MELDPKDKEIYTLLKRLKDSNGVYPEQMLTSRRQAYLRQVAQVSAGAGFVIALRNTIKGGKAAGAQSAAGTILEAFLVVAIVVEASAVAYFYREEIAQFVQNLTSQPRVEEITTPLETASPLAEVGITMTEPAATETETPTGTGTVTVTDTPVVTPSVLAAEPTGQGPNSQDPVQGATVVGSTPDPGDNNGNQYGLTPKPIRTKDPGGVDDSSTSEPKKNK